MNLGDIGRTLRTNVKQHSPVILSVAAGTGTLTTAYLAARASFKASELIMLEEMHIREDNRSPKERVYERTKLVWKLYIPTATSAATTIACIIGANRVELKKTIAAQTALAVSQQVYSDYRDKVIEEFGERKDQAIRDKIADDRVNKTAPGKDVIISGSGNVLCCELFSGRYFNSDMETLKKARNDINQKVLVHDYATLDDFYYLVGLLGTTYSGQLGWKSSRLMELDFSTVLTPDGRPCLAFAYNYTVPL